MGEGKLHSLILFDLDGFKRYNDTFGHPAGDTLLARLGANLSSTVSAHGEAYRIGGDEFCAIVRTDDLKEEAIIAGACEAFSDSGSGFSVRPSFGAVALGREAGHLRQALHKADQRMYAHKQGRPGSVTREARAVLLSILSEREPTLDEHLHAVARLAQLVGDELGLEGEELDVVVRAAELHDIGKMAMPDSVLRKPGPLSESEWEIMRRHTGGRRAHPRLRPRPGAGGDGGALDPRADRRRGLPGRAGRRGDSARLPDRLRLRRLQRDAHRARLRRRSARTKRRWPSCAAAQGPSSTPSWSRRSAGWCRSTCGSGIRGARRPTPRSESCRSGARDLRS